MQSQRTRPRGDVVVAATLTGGNSADLSKAKTVLRLLGGAGFIERTGATNLVGSSEELQMTIAPCGRPRKTINAVVIRFAADGTYRVWFGHHYQRGPSVRTISEHEEVQANELQALFGRQTGVTIQAQGA